MKESEEVYKNSKEYIWIVKIGLKKKINELEPDESVDYGTAISLEDNMILMPCLYFEDDVKYTITGRRLSEEGFERKLAIVFSQRWLGLTLLEEEKGLEWVSGKYGTLANDGSLGYAETLYTTCIYDRLIAYFSTGNAEFPCLDLTDLPDINELDGLTCGTHKVVGYGDFTEASLYRTIGDIFNIESFHHSYPSHDWTYEGKLHSSLPIVHCNGFSRFGEGTSGAPILNVKEEIVGMRIMSWTPFGIALHVSVIRLFIKQYRKYRKGIERKRKRESIESEEPAKKKKKSKKEEERRKKEDRRKKRQRQKERKKERKNNNSEENVVANMFQIDPSQHSHAYLYILGMTCIGLKRSPKALELLHNVVTAPASSLSALAVEAYRFSMSFPEYTSAAAQIALKNISQLYVELVSYYRKAKVSELEDYNDANKEHIENDDNTGLVYKQNVKG